jgi:hypothetical protein
LPARLSRPRAHDSTALMIVICAGMNALLPHDTPVGETWIVTGISACEVFNGSKCEDPTCQ